MYKTIVNKVCDKKLILRYTEYMTLLLKKIESLDEWEYKYMQLIEAGKKIEQLEEDERVEKNLVSGCTSKTWVKAIKNGENVNIKGYSKSQMVQGIIALIVDTFRDYNTEEIKDFDSIIFDNAGISELISLTRNAGMSQIISLIQAQLS